jgi:hypothetical protein
MESLHGRRRRRYIECMAALAQPDLRESAIREVLAPIPLPDGTSLQRLEFRDDSTGEPALFVVYSVKEGAEPDETLATHLQAVRAAVRTRLRAFGLPITPYTAFISA